MRYNRSSVGGARLWRLAALGAALIGAACGESPTPPATTAAPGKAQALSRALAVAMNEASVRTSVRDAMRASIVDGHKLVLQDYLASAQGATLRQAALKASGLSESAFAEMLHDAGRLDFSMPQRAQRRSWTLDQPFVVMSDPGKSAKEAFAYRPDGSEIHLTAKEQVKTLPAFFLLEREEYKGRRVHPQAAVAGKVIEDPNDGLGSEVYELRYPDGRRIVKDMADEPAAKTAQYVNGTTVLHGFQIITCDDWACSSDLEARVEIHLYNAQGNLLAWYIHTQGGIDAYYGHWNYPDVGIFSKQLEPGTGEYLKSWLFEEDFFGSDDFCGEVTMGAEANDDTRAYSVSGGCDVFGYPQSGAIWLRWSPPPPPGESPTASISYGPNAVRPYDTCSWEASASGGTPPYSFDWFEGFHPIGSGSSLQWANNGSSFTLVLRVTDARGMQGQTSMDVNVSEDWGMCPW